MSLILSSTPGRVAVLTDELHTGVAVWNYSLIQEIFYHYF